VQDWDDKLKRLFTAIPQDLVSWLMPGAIFLERVSLELKTLTKTRHADILLKMRVDGKTALLHVEVQKCIEAEMPIRVWEYNVAATLEHRCPAYSFVIYLMPDGNKEVPKASLTWGLPERGQVHAFQYTNIELWTRSVEALWEPGLLGILPLALLAADGMRYEVCEAICERVKVNSDLLSLTLTLATMVFTSQADQRWLRRMMDMFEDIVRDTWFYQHILEQGLEQGRAQEREQALGEIRLILLDMVRVRFPDVTGLAQQRANAMHDTTLLRQVIRQMMLASTAEEARRSLLEIPPADPHAGQSKQGSADLHAGNNGV
jgi:predicted transposase YdaD